MRSTAYWLATLTVATLMLGACRGDQAATPATIVDTTVGAGEPPGLDGFTGEVVLTRQRDLLDRGLINVRTQNNTGHRLILTDRALVADHFDSEQAEPRTTIIGNGRTVAVQVPYGVANDCDSAADVSAEFTFTYTTDTDDEPRSGAIEVGGTEILDDLRAEQCAAQIFAATTESTFANVAVSDGAVATDLILTHIGDGNSFTVGRVFGTILVGVDSGEDQRIVLDQAEPVVTVPLLFVVNRCDPHALAEVTKRYGLDMEVSINGAVPQLVPIDVSPLVTQLEAIVEQCKDAEQLSEGIPPHD